MVAAPAADRTASRTARRAMGSDAHVIVVAAGAADHLHEVAWRRIEELEGRWSRFRPDSEVSVLNRCAGRPVPVSNDTFALVERAAEAWRRTRGRFDPTVGDALVAHGYDRDLRELGDRVARAPVTARPAPGLHGVLLDPWLPSVTLPRGTTFDPGGIGKGLAADLVAATLLDAGATGALVNLGGDLAATGAPPSAEGWVVAVPDPLRPRRELLRLAVRGGSVATSSPLRRRWPTTGGEAHHLIDPATGRPAVSPVAAATVVAGEAWWAEALATALVLAGPGELDQYPGAHAVVVTADGAHHATPALAGILP